MFKKGDQPQITGKKAPKKKKIILIIIIVAVVLALAWFFAAQAGKAKGIPVSTGKIQVMDLEQIVSIKGTVEGSDSANVFSSVPYRIVSVLVKEGDKVAKGQNLATLDASELRDQYGKAALQLSQSKRDYENASVLYREGAISQSEFLQAKTRYESDRLTLSSFDLSEKSNVTSPISGTVTRVSATAGKLASGVGTEPLFVVENLGQLQMKVNVTEQDIHKIKVGQSVTLTADVLGKGSASGIVSRIAPTGEQKDQASKERVIPVTIDINNDSGELIAGVTARAKILTGERSQALSAPIDAILEDPDTGDFYIFRIKKDQTLKKIKVETGLRSDLFVEITGDKLKDGDTVVLAPSFDLKDGDAVMMEGAEKNKQNENKNEK